VKRDLEEGGERKFTGVLEAGFGPLADFFGLLGGTGIAPFKSLSV